MNNGLPISQEVLDMVEVALLKDKHWIAYNNSMYFINKDDVHFFDFEHKAKEFAKNNFTDRDSYQVMLIHSVNDLHEDFSYSSISNTEQVKDPDSNGLYNRDGNAFTGALIEHWEQKQSLFNSPLKTNVMNKENFQYLSDNLKYLGFGEKLNEAMEKNIGEQKPDFTLKMQTEINKKPVEADLHFKKSETTDMYFFNRYDVRIKNTEDQSKDLQQTFYINKGQGVTLKESYNLLEGRAVHKNLTDKEGEKYKAWVQLDLSAKDDKGNYNRQQYHENYGYNVDEVLAKYPIKELLAPKQKEDLVNSIQKGNVQMVTLVKDGKSEKLYLEADPKYKDVKVYDSKMQLLPKEEKEKRQSIGQTGASQALKEEQGADKKKDLKQEVKPEKESVGKDKTIKKNDKSLLPKKREGNKKGMGIS